MYNQHKLYISDKQGIKTRSKYCILVVNRTWKLGQMVTNIKNSTEKKCLAQDKKNIYELIFKTSY